MTDVEQADVLGTGSQADGQMIFVAQADLNSEVCSKSSEQAIARGEETTSLQPAKDQAEQVGIYARCVFEPTDIVEVRLYKPGTVGPRDWIEASKLATLVRGLDGHNRSSKFNIAVGANPRNGRGGTKKYVALARTLFVDFDEANLETATQFLNEAGLPEPTMVIASGHGIHAYWRLDEPLRDLKVWTRAQKNLIERCHSDDKIHDAPRIMRLPGFYNQKSTPVVCRIIRSNESLTYPLTELVKDADRANRAARPSTSLAAGGLESRGIRKATRRFIQNGAREGERNRQLFLAACDLARLGKSIIEATRILQPPSIRCGLGMAEILRTIDSAYCTEGTGQPASHGDGQHDANRINERARPTGHDHVGDELINNENGSNPPSNLGLLVAGSSNGKFILIPGTHFDDRGIPIEVGNDDYADDVIAALPSGTFYRRGGPGILSGEQGSKSFQQLNVEGMRLLMDKYTPQRKWPKGDRSRGALLAPTTTDRAKLVLEKASNDVRVPELRHLTSFPVYVGDGDLTKSGFSAGVYYDEPEALRGLEPVRDQTAINLALDDLLIDFPFRAEADRQNLTSMMLTLLLRPAVDGNVPIFLVKAPLERTGKTKLINDVCCRIIMGHPTAAETMPATNEEMDKRILANLVAANPLILLDNVPGHIDSSALAAAITSRIFKGRILGKTQMVEVPNNSVFVATGNNVQCTGELAKRVVPITLQPASDAPELRSDFVHPDLVSYVATHRRHVLACLLGMVENWKAAGRPPGSQRVGGFEEWARIIGGVMHVQGYGSWMTNWNDWYAQTDDHTADLKELVAQWHETHGEEPVKAAELLKIAEGGDLFTVHFSKCVGAKSMQTVFGRAVLARAVDQPVGEWIVRKRTTSRPAKYCLEARK